MKERAAEPGQVSDTRVKVSKDGYVRERPSRVSKSDRLKPTEAMICREVVDQPALREALLSAIRRASVRGAGSVAGSLLVVEKTSGDGRFALKTLCDALGTEALVHDGGKAIGEMGALKLQEVLDARPSRSGVKVLLLDRIHEATPQSLALWTRSIRRDGVDVVADVAAGLVKLDLTDTIVVAIAAKPDMEPSIFNASPLKDAIAAMMTSPEKPSSDPYLTAWDKVVVTETPSREHMNKRIDVELNVVRDELERETMAGLAAGTELFGSLPIRLHPKAREFLATRAAEADVYDVRWLVNRFVRLPIAERIGTGEITPECMIVMVPSSDGKSLEPATFKLESVKPLTLRAKRADEVLKVIDPIGEAKAKQEAATQLELQHQAQEAAANAKKEEEVRLASEKKAEDERLATEKREADAKKAEEEAKEKARLADEKRQQEAKAREEAAAAQRLKDEQARLQRENAARVAAQTKAAADAAAAQERTNRAEATSRFALVQRGDIPAGTRVGHAEYGLGLIGTMPAQQAAQLLESLPLGQMSLSYTPLPGFISLCHSAGIGVFYATAEVECALIAIGKVVRASPSERARLHGDALHLIHHASNSQSFAANAQRVLEQLTQRIPT